MTHTNIPLPPPPLQQVPTIETHQYQEESTDRQSHQEALDHHQEEDGFESKIINSKN